jgi:hypothetical protein
MTYKQTKFIFPVLLLAVLSLSILSTSIRAQGGPPMVTDDPATPGAGMWEVNFLTTLSRSRDGSIFETPLVDLNYGLGNHIQLKLEAPWLVMKETGEKSESGLGNSMVGVKWRFLDEERRGLAMSIYPQLEFNNPTNSVERGLVEKGAALFLPVEAAKNLGSVKVNSEVGYRATQHGKDEWEYGILFARSVIRRIELLAELHGSALRSFREDELFFNVGSRIQVAKNTVLLVSAGRTIRNAGGSGPQTIAALGVQFNFRNRMPGFAHNMRTAAKR